MIAYLIFCFIIFLLTLALLRKVKLREALAIGAISIIPLANIFMLLVVAIVVLSGKV